MSLKLSIASGLTNVVLDYNSKKIMNTISGKYLDCFEKFII